MEITRQYAGYAPGVGITGRLRYEDLGDGENVALVRPFVVQTRGRTLEAHEGFVFNFASIPWLFRRLIPSFDRHNPAAVIHDMIYEHADALGISRTEADLIYLDICLRCGVPRWKAYAEYAGLSVGGWWSWRRCRRREHKRKGKTVVATY